MPFASSLAAMHAGIGGLSQAQSNGLSSQAALSMAAQQQHQLYIHQQKYQQMVQMQPWPSGTPVDCALNDVRHEINELKKRDGLNILSNKETPKMGMLRGYLEKHKDFVFTLGVIVLADHFILAGALRTRIQRIVEAVLSRLEHSIGLDPKVIDAGK